jgi:hypothetical protein
MNEHHVETPAIRKENLYGSLEQRQQSNKDNGKLIDRLLTAIHAKKVEIKNYSKQLAKELIRIISPLLANIALHGMEQELGINYTLVHHGKKTSYENHTPYTMCIYADDFVILCERCKVAD